MKLLLGKMEEQLKHLDDNSVDSVVTDPPYGIDFMGKGWDAGVPGKEMWEEVLRVLKPGGHLISFSSARTYHRSTVAIEDAGFEIRDQIMWVYGSGFPKSHNLGKAYDKKFSDTNPFEGWGTAIKPCHEPITLARKPISEKTVVDNAIKWGVGGINVDASRVPNAADDKFNDSMVNKDSYEYGIGAPRKAGGNAEAVKKLQEQGRFPANFIHNGVFNDEPWGKYFYVPKVSKKDRNEGLSGELPSLTTRPRRDDGSVIYRETHPEEWAEAKAKQDRAQLTAIGGADEFHKTKQSSLANTHPTVKPTDLMHYLIRMVTPTNGIVLDPFMGSGSTGKAAIRYGYDFIGIEMEDASFEVAKARIEYEDKSREDTGGE